MLKSVDGNTELHKSAARNQVREVQGYIASHPSWLYVRNTENKTPIGWAFIFFDNTAEALKLLLTQNEIGDTQAELLSYIKIAAGGGVPNPERIHSDIVRLLLNHIERKEEAIRPLDELINTLENKKAIAPTTYSCEDAYGSSGSRSFTVWNSFRSFDDAGTKDKILQENERKNKKIDTCIAKLMELRLQCRSLYEAPIP